MMSRMWYDSDYPNYRFGFNGKEMDHEAKGNFAQLDYGNRIYDPRCGCFLSVDPLSKNYAELSPYQFASNNPIIGVDQDGLELKQKIKKIGIELFKQTTPGKILFNPTSREIAIGFIQRAVETLKGYYDLTKQKQRSPTYGDGFTTLTAGVTPFVQGNEFIQYYEMLEKAVIGIIQENYKLAKKAIIDGDRRALGGLIFEAAMLVVPGTEEVVLAKFAGRGIKGIRGVDFILENSAKSTAAQAFEDATEGALTHLATKKRIVPIVYFDNPNPRGMNYVRGDGAGSARVLDDGTIEIIDAKLDVTNFTKQLEDLKRVSLAVKQNPNVRWVIEVPDQKAYKNALRALNKAGVNNIPVRIRK